MKIIKQGQKPENQPWQLTCGICGTIFGYERSDIRDRRSPTKKRIWDGEEYYDSHILYFYINCPVCPNEIRLSMVHEAPHYRAS